MYVDRVRRVRARRLTGGGKSLSAVLDGGEYKGDSYMGYGLEHALGGMMRTRGIAVTSVGSATHPNVSRPVCAQCLLTDI